MQETYYHVCNRILDELVRTQTTGAPVRLLPIHFIQFQKNLTFEFADDYQIQHCRIAASFVNKGSREASRKRGAFLFLLGLR